MNRSTRIGLVLILAVTLLGVQTASAQGRKPRQPQAPTEKLKTSGTVKGIQAGVLHVVTEEGDQYLVKPPAKPQGIVYNASADASWLRRGMYVSFSANFEKKSGKPVGTVKQLTVFVPKPDSKLGVAPGSGGAGAGNLFADEEPSDKPKVETQSFSISGAVRSISKTGKMSVQAGQVQVGVQLADDARVSVDWNNLSLVRTGDKASITGWYYVGNKKSIYANQLTITAAEPLGAPKKTIDKDANKQADKDPTPSKG